MLDPSQVRNNSGTKRTKGDEDGKNGKSAIDPVGTKKKKKKKESIRNISEDRQHLKQNKN